MTIEELNNRIALLENELESIKQERDRLSEPTFERRIGERYYYLRGIYHWYSDVDHFDHADDTWNYKNNNYFYSEKRANEVLEKINLLLKLERLHDTYCPDYVPDWDDGCAKYIVPYDMVYKCYCVGCVYAICTITDVYFPTKEIAEKVRDILNAEQERDYGSDLVSATQKGE